MEVSVMELNAPKHIVTKSRKCPKCGSTKAEAFLSGRGSKYTLKCKRCEYIISEQTIGHIPESIKVLQYRLEHPLLAQIHIIVGMMLFSAGCAMIARYIFSIFGVM